MSSNELSLVSLTSCRTQWQKKTSFRSYSTISSNISKWLRTKQTNIKTVWSRKSPPGRTLKKIMKCASNKWDSSLKESRKKSITSIRRWLFLSTKIYSECAFRKTWRQSIDLILTRRLWSLIRSVKAISRQRGILNWQRLILRAASLNLKRLNRTSRGDKKKRSMS